jgi:hypothetical protein
MFIGRSICPEIPVGVPISDAAPEANEIVEFALGNSLDVKINRAGWYREGRVADYMYPVFSYSKGF